MKLIFLIAGILFCLAIPIVGVGSTAINYHGICYGFTDSQSPCTWMEFARNEMFWASFIFIPLLFFAAVVWILMAAVQFVVEMRQKHKEKASKAERQ
jgi:hypothetical protein